MSLTRFDCAVCGFPLPDDHLDWHTDPTTGEDVHARCCTECFPPVHDDQGMLFVAKPHPDGTLLRVAQTPASVDDVDIPARVAVVDLMNRLEESVREAKAARRAERGR